MRFYNVIYNVIKEVKDAAIKKITKLDKEYCEFSPCSSFKPRGSSFCLCNQTEWKVRVEFVVCAPAYSCTGIASDSSRFELGPHAARRVTLNRPPANTPPCGCNVIISREIDGVWHQCSGNGGGPDLLIDPP